MLTYINGGITCKAEAAGRSKRSAGKPGAISCWTPIQRAADVLAMASASRAVEVLVSCNT
jgi:hypothetical protein